MYVYVAVALAAALAAGAGTWKVQNWRYSAIEKERLEAAAEKARIDAKRIDTAATGHEADKGAIRTEFVVITQEVERVVQTPFYAAGQQCFDDDGLRQLRSAAGIAQPASQPANPVPRHSATQ